MCFCLTVAPSNPICKIKGVAEYGQNINLTCVSEEGSPAPTYQWQNYDVENVLRPLPPKATASMSVIHIYFKNVMREIFISAFRVGERLTYTQFVFSNISF